MFFAIGSIFCGVKCIFHVSWILNFGILVKKKHNEMKTILFLSTICQNQGGNGVIFGLSYAGAIITRRVGLNIAFHAGKILPYRHLVDLRRGKAHHDTGFIEFAKTDFAIFERRGFVLPAACGFFPVSSSGAPNKAAPNTLAALKTFSTSGRSST